MNEYAQLDLAIEAHPKYKRLARLIGRDPLGYLCHLMLACGNSYPDGRIPADWVEDACCWDGEPGVLLAALRDAKIYDKDNDGKYHGWDERSGRVLAEIQDKHEEKKERDRIAAAERRAARKEAAEREQREAEERARRDASPDVAGNRATSPDVAGVGERRSESRYEDGDVTITKTEPALPPDLDILPAGQRAGAGAGARVETEAEARSVDRLQAGVRKTWKGKHGDDRATLLELARGCPDGWTLERYTDRLLECMAQVAESGEYGRAPLPPHKKSKFVVSDAKSFAIVHGEALVLFPSRLPPPPTLADRNAWEAERQVQLERESREPGKRLTPEQLAAIAAQVHEEADRKFGPIARAGPAPPSASSSTSP